jgi:DNA-binding YbaB/EbfC family protein
MANPFSQMKDLYKLQKEAKEMQKKLKDSKIQGESRDGFVTLYMNGAQEFEDINIDVSLLDPEMETVLKRDIEEAFKDFQKKLQKEMMKDFDMDKIKQMLG